MLKIGDQVVVTEKAKSGANGWGNVWVREMDAAVGNTYEVLGVRNSQVTLRVGHRAYSFPLSVIKNVNRIPDLW